MPIFPPNLSIQDQECAQTLSTAIENGDLATVRRVLTTWPWQPRAGFDSGDDIADLWPFKAVLSGAIESGNTELASYVLGCGLKAELYVTMLALDLGSIDMYQVLVDHGWDINMPLSQGNPPLLAYLLRDETLTRWFLAHGASPNAPASRFFYTPLMMASQLSPLASVKLLCAHTTSLENALQCAAGSEAPGRLEVIEFLLDQGADIDAIKWKDHQFSYECWEIASLGTAINHAVLGGFKDRVELLLRRGARIDLKNSLGQTPLDVARKDGRDDICALLESGPTQGS